MKCSTKTFSTFTNAKCGLVSMSKDKLVHDTPNGDILLFYPFQNKMTLNKVVGRSEEYNMPIIQTETNIKEWKIETNEQLEIALKEINSLKNN